jgi:uncharacterized protein
MKLHAERAGGQHYIQRFEGSVLHISGRQFTTPVVVGPDRILDDWCTEGDIRQLGIHHFEAIMALEPELILLGTGPRVHRPEPRLIHTVLSRGVGLEVMDTAAACRTYNVLVAEDRRVVAALFPV